MSDAPTRSVAPAGEPTADLPSAPTRDPSDPTAVHPAAPVAAPAPVVPPGYELLEEVGSGGMGIVYRARELAFDRDVAVKILQDRFPVNAPSARRFLDEARITGQLQHPAIPPVHHIGTLPDGRPFLVMKLIKGNTLSDLMVFEPTNRGRFVAVFAQVCQAVAYAHSRKVIHRDLKPQNVMVGAFGEVQVMDWGLAKVLASGGCEPPVAEPDDERTEIRTQRDGDAATQAGSVLGTPAYMAPEQAQGAVAEIDERADVFGLGAVLCVILTGKPPYWGMNSEAIRLLSIRGETADAFARLDACRADPELVALCKRCLSAKREDRPRDAGEVAEAVTAHLIAAEERARQAELNRVRSDEQRKRRRVQFVLAGAVLLALALAGVGAGIASLWRSAEQAKGEAETERGRVEELLGVETGLRGNLQDTNGKLELALTGERTARQGEAAAMKEVERVLEKLARTNHGRTIQVAYQLWKDNKIAEARTLLAGTRPDLRGWEYDYVHRLCHADLVTFNGHTGPVNSAIFSPDGPKALTASADGTARIWDVATGKRLVELKGHTGPVNCAVFSPDGSKVLTASRDKTARIWDAASGNMLTELKGHNVEVRTAVFSPDGSRVLTTSDDMSTISADKTARIWDTATGKPLVEFRGHTSSGYASSVYPAVFSPDGSKVVTGSFDGTARVWDAATGKRLVELEGHDRPVRSPTFSPDGSKVVTASDDGTARIWDSASGKTLAELKGHTGFVFSAVFSPDGSKVLTGSTDKTARIWDAASGKQLVELKGHTSWVTSAAFSAEGSRILTASADKTARIWHATSGKTLTELRGHSGAVHSVVFSPDGSKVLTASSDGTARVWGWEAATGKTLAELRGYASLVRSTVFSPDGSRVLATGGDGTIRLREAATGKTLAELKGRTGTVNTTVFSPDGTRVLATSGDGTIRLCDSESGAEVLALPGYEYAAFSPDGTRIATWTLPMLETVVIYDSRPVNRAFFHIAPRPRAKP